MMRAPPGEPNARVTKWILTPLAWLIGIAFILPVVWVVVGSIRPTNEVLGNTGLSLALLVPSRLTLANFENLFSGPFTSGIINSFIVVSVSTGGGLVLCTLAAFALSALRFPYRDLLFAIVVVSFTIPVDSTAFALLSLARSWGLDNSYGGLILPFMVDGIAIFLLRQFFLGIPRELVDAARVDGASWFTVLWRLFVPLSKPALIGAGMILFLDQWTAYLWPILIVNTPNMDIAPVALVKVATGRYFTDWGQLMAGSAILAGVPALILLPLQRYFTQSLTLSGLNE